MQNSYPTTLPDLRTALTQANSICIIEHVIDLNNTTIYIASNVVIRFEGGLIKERWDFIWESSWHTYSFGGWRI